MVKVKDKIKKEETETKGNNANDVNNARDSAVLKKKIEYLEEELVRKDKMIEKLKEENLLLFRTALKRSEQKVSEKNKKE